MVFNLTPGDFTKEMGLARIALNIHIPSKQ